MSVVAVACLAPMQGSTLQQLSLNDMILKSTAIVSGTIQPTYTAFRGAMVYSHYQVTVADIYKGAPKRTWDLAVPGGVANGMRQDFAGVPTLASGQKYFLFLWTSKSGLTQVIGLSQGLFNVTTDASGQTYVSRGATSETMVNASGQVVTDSSIQMTLSDMVARIQTVLAGGGAQ
jgi:hypothetical protein